jgi:hypothetical protein
MTNKQLYNLVFENYIQAKRELIREGYLKTEESKNIDFNEIFSRTKGAMQEKKIEKLQRENQMLREKLAKKQLTKENLLGDTGSFETGGAGSESLWNALTKVFAKVGVKTAMIDVVIDKLKAIDSQENNKYSNIKNIITDSNDISKFEIKLKKYINLGNNLFKSIRMSLDELRKQNSQNTLAENRRRRY